MGLDCGLEPAEGHELEVRRRVTLVVVASVVAGEPTREGGAQEPRRDVDAGRLITAVNSVVSHLQLRQEGVVRGPLVDNEGMSPWLEAMRRPLPPGP